MTFITLPAADALARIADFDTIIDARSESEYALDHLPNAVNWWTLNDEERKRIGTMYVQIGAFEAKKHGAVAAARNISRHIEQYVLDKPKHWKPLTYCWRGGKRSGSLSLILDQIGFKVTLIEGGYKAFRAAMLLDISKRVEPLRFIVICGATGSGKTRLLHALAAAGAQVLDLEALARHRSSVLGAIPNTPQPTQKHFDTLVWDVLRHFNPERPVYVESESKKVGNVALPTVLIDKIRSSPCLNLELNTTERVALLMEDYDYFVCHTDFFCNRLDTLVELRGKAVIQGWKDSVVAGNIETVVQELLTQHYDPVYLQSMHRNFCQYERAISITPANRSTEAMRDLAASVLTLGDGATGVAAPFAPTSGK
jgi:tRNA 2-selenouridine synthase